MRLRRFRFALAVLTLLGLAAAFIVWRGGRERRLIAEIESQGGQVFVDSSDPYVIDLLERLHGDDSSRDRDVFLDGPRFDDQWLQQHSYLDGLQIRQLVVRYSGLSPGSFAALLREHGFESFTARGPSVTDEEVRLLAAHDDLIGLDLEHTRVGDAALAAIGPERLERVMLGKTEVTVSGLGVFRGSNKLQGIGLDGRQLTPECVAILATCPNLDLVRLIGPEVDDAALQRLVSLTTLRTVYLESTQVAPEGIDAFKAALPACGVNVISEEDRFFDPTRAE
jgi:hypothetical protein